MVSISKSRVKARHAPLSRADQAHRQQIFVIAALVLSVWGLGMIVHFNSGGTASTATATGTDASWFRKENKPDAYKADHMRLNLKEGGQPLLSEAYNAIAMDIFETLDCKTVLNKTSSKPMGGMDDYWERERAANAEGGDLEPPQRRRLQEGMAADDGDDSNRAEAEGGAGGDANYNNNNNNTNPGDGMMDDRAAAGLTDDYRPGDLYYTEATAKELFCLAASTTTLTPEQLQNSKERIICDATGTKQTSLLDLWSAARAKMDESLLKKTLDIAVESSRTLLDKTVHLWAPAEDNGINYILNEVSNKDENASNNGNNFHGLGHNLGANHLYVDVGSCLGITTLAVIMQYPQTKVVSIEPASPNWLMQELNLRCNLEPDQMPTVLLAGVGPHTQETMAAKLLWRPSATTATRAWSPATEKTADDVELFVQLRSWHSVLAEADVYRSHHIDVLHVDCEGCEYNLIPSLTESEFDSIDTVMGGLHWGYIPVHKLPSSERGKLTHDRLCQHENFARTAMECCGNLELPVISSVPGEVLVREGSDTTKGGATVKDVIAEDLCAGFPAWSEEHRLYTSDNDYGWFELSSVST